MNAKAEQKERTHQTILQSTYRLLRQKGISGASVADVMKGAGLTVGGFYAHFDSKDALIDEALRRTSAEMREGLFDRLDEKPLADRAVVVLKRYLSAAHRDDTTGGCPLPAVVGEIGSTAVEHRTVLSEQLEAMAAGLQSQLPAPRGALSPRHLAMGVAALMYGGLSLARALKGTALSDEILKACREVGSLALRANATKE